MNRTLYLRTPRSWEHMLATSNDYDGWLEWLLAAEDRGLVIWLRSARMWTTNLDALDWLFEYRPVAEQQQDTRARERRLARKADAWARRQQCAS